MNRKKFLKSLFVGGIATFIPNSVVPNESQKETFTEWEAVSSDNVVMTLNEQIKLPPKQGIDMFTDAVTFIQPDYLRTVNHDSHQYIITLIADGLIADDLVEVQVDGIDIQNNHIRQIAHLTVGRPSVELSFCFAEDRCPSYYPHYRDIPIVGDINSQHPVVQDGLRMMPHQFLTHWGMMNSKQQGDNQIAVVRITKQPSKGRDKTLYVTPKLVFVHQTFLPKSLETS